MHFADFRFDNSSLHALPVEFVPDDARLVQSQRQVKGACWSPIKPEPLKSPVLVAASLPCLGLLDLQAAQVCTVAVPAHSSIDQSCAWVAVHVLRLCLACQSEDPSFVEHFSGNRLLPGSETAAHCYAGHQFGHFSGQLGDGAAIYLGEVALFHSTIPGSSQICVPPCHAVLLTCIVLVCLCFPVQAHQVACPI